jgi:hypothetical protein
MIFRTFCRLFFDFFEKSLLFTFVTVSGILIEAMVSDSSLCALPRQSSRTPLCAFVCTCMRVHLSPHEGAQPRRAMCRVAWRVPRSSLTRNCFCQRHQRNDRSLTHTPPTHTHTHTHPSPNPTAGFRRVGHRPVSPSTFTAPMALSRAALHDAAHVRSSLEFSEY